MPGDDFEAVLDDIAATGDAGPRRDPAQALKRFGTLAALAVDPARPPGDDGGPLRSQVAGAYADADQTSEGAPDAPPAGPRITLAQLRADLRRDLSIKELCGLRRRFAFEHHPDRVPADERRRASRRLALANDLIDRAVMKACRKSAAT